MQLIRRLSAREDGWSVLTAVMVMTLLLALGLATLSYVDGQQSQSGRERVAESSFNLSEGVLSAQAFVLSSRWPTALQPAPSTCTQAITDDTCPAQATLQPSFDQTDYAAATTWSTQVRDDYDPAINPAGPTCAPGSAGDQFYSDAVLSNRAYDANCNGELWVKSEALVRGRRRVLVARVKIEEVAEEFPEQLVTAGKFQTSNNGNKVIVDRNGLSDQWNTRPGRVAVRCTDQQSPACASNVREGQIAPCCIEYGEPSATYGAPSAVARLRARARAQGTYFAGPGCPSTLANPTTRIVFIEQTPAAGCSYTGNDQFYSETAPGLLVIANGKVELSGTTNFYGLIYAANLQGSTAMDVVKVHGNGQINGAAAVDGGGGITTGSSKANLVWDPRVFDDPLALKSYGTAGVLKNTFRELPAAP